MAFRLLLAGHLGKTLAELESMSSLEFSLWQEHYINHPFGNTRVLLSMLVTILSNAYRKPDTKGIELSDLLPQPQASPDRAQTIDEMRAMADAVCLALGGG